MKCEACRFFDCGNKCVCTCHHSAKPIIRKGPYPEGEKMSMRKREGEGMEGLSSLFG